MLKNIFISLIIIIALLCGLAVATEIKIIDESIISRQPPYSEIEIKKIYAQCSGVYVLMIGIFTKGPFKDAPHSPDMVSSMKRIEDYYQRKGRYLKGRDFDETSENAYEKMRTYFNESNKSQEGQRKFFKEFEKIGETCMNFERKINK